MVSLVAEKFHFSPLAVVVLGLFLNQNIDTDASEEGCKKPWATMFINFAPLMKL